MFFGHINKVDFHLYPKAIQTALRFLQETDFDQLATGRYPIEGDLIYAQVLDLETKEKSEILPEVHRHYVDVQYLHRGIEQIGIAIDLGKSEIAVDYNPERDIQFYQEAPDESMLTMRAGNFAVFFPTDIHRPGCVDGKVSQIRKIVVKIAVSQLTE